MWNPNNGMLIMTLEGHISGVLSLAVLQNGYLANGSNDGTIIIWNTNEGNILKTIEGNFHESVWPENKFHYATLGNVTHILTAEANKTLFKKIFK